MICLRCGEEFVGTGILCPFCVADLERAKGDRTNRENQFIKENRNTMLGFRIKEMINTIISVISIFFI
jgi:hypothetical protein